ncbi:MAG: cell division protein ZapB [Candidatus Berkiellales bacterium]
MTSNLFYQLEQKVAHAVEIIQLLRLQIEELEEENVSLRAEHEKWRHDLISLIQRFDQIDDNLPASVAARKEVTRHTDKEEEFMTV